MQVHRSLAFFLLISLTSARGSAQIHIVPEAVNMVEGERVFQLLDSHGVEIKADGWSVSEPAGAEVTMRDGRAVVTFTAIGQFTVTASSSGQSTTAQVNVLESFSELQKRVPWIFSPIHDTFSSVLHAWAPEPDGVYFFYEDRSAAASTIRAIGEDGIQLWTWPAPGSQDIPTLVCGNMSGGVLLSVGSAGGTVLVMLDARGNEMWRHPAPGFTGGRTFLNEDLFFMVEDNPGHTSALVVGLDQATGKESVSVDLPRSRQLLRNTVSTQQGHVCSPGSEVVEPIPLHHSDLQTGINNVGHLSFTVTDLVADAGKCTPGQPVSPASVTIVYSQRLERLNLHGDGGTTVDTLETNTAEGLADKTAVMVSIPTGDIIPDYTGEGNFIAVRRTAVHWPNMSPAMAAEFEYRVTAQGEVTDRYQMPSTLQEQKSVMLLGDENKTGLTARGKILVAFETETGKRLWWWQAHSEDTYPLAALADGGVIVKDGPYYLILNRGGSVRNLLPPGFFEFYMHWKVPTK